MGENYIIFSMFEYELLSLHVQIFILHEGLCIVSNLCEQWVLIPCTDIHITPTVEDNFTC